MKRTLALVVAAGLLLGLSAPPRGVYALAYAGLALWMTALASIPEDRGPVAWFVSGWVVTSTINAIVLSWSTGLMVEFAGFPWVVALLVSVLLWTSQGLVGGFASLLARALTLAGVPAPFALALMIPLAVRVTPALFPWPFATSQLELLPLVQWAELGGTALLDLLLATIVALGVQAVRKRDVRYAHASVAMLAAVLGLGAWRMHGIDAMRARAAPLRVGVVQPNIGIREKHDPERAAPTLERLRAMTRELERDGADLVVWPETAFPYRVHHSMRREPRGPYAIHGNGIDGPLLVGALSVDGSEQARNSVFSLASDGRVLGVADKVELLAFGEYVPLWDVLPPLRHFFPQRGIMPGEQAISLRAGPSTVGVLNCYEDVLDAHARTVAGTGPTWLVNVTNDAWFGDTDEPHLHNAVARFRAIETRRDLVRAVNTGVSAHIDANGRIEQQTRTYEQRAFIASVAPMTLATPWVLLGDWVSPALFGVWLTLTFAARSRAASAARRTA